ncbi:CD3337/EF1877 family mobilome membrane protein [Enterococcus sp. AZ012]|uniref:CD3337/EF1877 family mobilome membrane protein n=1 Tax=unclassified Enterococcus TaxID=2608891 RepID=UPI003D2BDCE5
MKNNKYFKWLALFLLFFTLMTTVSADAAPTPINPNEDATVVDKAEQYSLDSYQSYMFERPRFFQNLDIANWLNGGANLFFDLNKIVYSMFRTGIDLFGNANVVNDYVSVFTVYSKSMYDSLYRDFGLTIIIAMALYCLYLYIIRSPQQAAKQFFAFSAVVVMSMVWNNSATTIIRDFNSLTEEVQGNLIRTTSNAQSTNAATPVTHAQNTLFELAIEEPFLLMNFGMANRSDVISEYEASTLSSLLFQGEWDEKKDEDIKDFVEEMADDNVFMTTEKAGWKFVVGFLSPITTIVLGTPILIIQVLNLLTGVMALVVAAFIGLAMFISMIPKFRGAFLKSLQTLIGLFGVRVLLGISFMMLVSVINVVRGVIPADGVANYLLQVIAITVTLVVIWKNRDKIFKMISGGMISSADGGIWNKASAPLKKKVKDTAKLGADAVGLATVGMPLGEVGGRLAENTKENAYDIFSDRQAFKQHEQDLFTQVAVDDYFDTVDRAKSAIDEENQATNQPTEAPFKDANNFQAPTEDINADDVALDADAVQVEINELLADDVHSTNDDFEEIDALGIDKVETENVEQAEINELEATDVQFTNEDSEEIDTIEVDHAETENVEQAEIQELEATDVQQTKEDIAPIDAIELQNEETKNVEQAEIQELEATDVQQTKEDIATIDTIEIQNAETENVEQAEINELEAADVQATGVGFGTEERQVEALEMSAIEGTNPEITLNPLETMPEIELGLPDVSMEYLDQQTNEFFNHLENETLVQANNVFETEIETNHVSAISESFEHPEQIGERVGVDFQDEVNQLAADSKASFDALFGEVRGE